MERRGHKARRERRVQRVRIERRGPKECRDRKARRERKECRGREARWGRREYRGRKERQARTERWVRKDQRDRAALTARRALKVRKAFRVRPVRQERRLQSPGLQAATASCAGAAPAPRASPMAASWDDEDGNNTNTSSGSLPDGVFNSNTVIQFCCKSARRGAPHFPSLLRLVGNDETPSSKVRAAPPGSLGARVGVWRAWQEHAHRERSGSASIRGDLGQRVVAETVDDDLRRAGQRRAAQLSCPRTAAQSRRSHQEEPHRSGQGLPRRAGGEATARFEATTEVSVEGKAIRVREATLDAASTLDFVKLFTADTDRKTAYAYAEWPVGHAMRAMAMFGSDDAAVVWLNGKEVHRAVFDRALDPGSDTFDLPLTAGTNRILVKVDNGFGGWGFALRVFDDTGRKRMDARSTRRHLDRLGLGRLTGGYYQIQNVLPEIGWTNWVLGEQVFDKPEVRVRWFGPDLDETDRASAQGQYTALVEATTRDGYAYRHMLTFAKVPDDTVPWFPSPPFGEQPDLHPTLPIKGGQAPLNAAQAAELSRYFWHGANDALWEGEKAPSPRWHSQGSARSRPPRTSPRGSAMGTSRPPSTTAAAHEDRRAHAQVDPSGGATPDASTRASHGIQAQAGVKPGTAQKLRAVARDWAKADPNPLVVLVARHGVIFLHEGLNGFRKDSTFRPASIGKTMAALTFARAVDQGILSFDQPVGTVLEDWKNERTAKVTFRHCFNHVSGLTDHASHGGLFNTYLDNALFVEDATFAKPLTRFQYNGDDVNLTGQALELVTGETIWRLLYENVQKPFGENVTQFDLGFGDQFSAMFLAKVGQMILQDGKYGSFQLFKPGFLETMRPRKIIEFAPQLDDPKIESGIGFAWMIDPSGPREKGVLGPNVIGHGAASGVTWRIDRDHDLVVVVGRNGFKDYRTSDEWQTKFVKTLAEGL